jgi:hypothetical protein
MLLIASRQQTEVMTEKSGRRLPKAPMAILTMNAIGADAKGAPTGVGRL